MSATQNLALLALTAALASGCVSQYSQGPRFAPVTVPPELGVVHVYRPQSSWGAATDINVYLHGRAVALCSGSFATIVVPPGKHTVQVSIYSFTNLVIMNGMGFTGVAASSTEANVHTPVEVEVTPGQAVYVKVEFASREEPPAAVAVSAADGLDDLDGLHMIPGGRGRWPVFLPGP